MRLLVVGTGTASLRHAENLTVAGTKFTDVHVVSSRPKGPHIQNFGDSVVLWRSVAEALEGNSFDAAVIAPVSRGIAPAVALCVEAGVKCLVEKPLGVDSADVELLERVRRDRSCRQAWKASRVSLQYRFSPAYRGFKQICKSGELGEIVGMAVRFSEYLPNWKQDYDWRSSYAANSALGGGVLRTQCHELDLVNDVFGPIEVVGATFKSSETLGLNVEDAVSMLLLGQNGGSTFPISVTLDMCRDDNARYIRVDGTKGSVAVDLLQGRLFSHEEQQFVNSDRASLFRLVASDFIQPASFEGASLDEGLKLSKLILQIQGLARTV